MWSLLLYPSVLNNQSGAPRPSFAFIISQQIGLLIKHVNKFHGIMGGNKIYKQANLLGSFMLQWLLGKPAKRSTTLACHPEPWMPQTMPMKAGNQNKGGEPYA
jgi:hypothetical protein